MTRDGSGRWSSVICCCFSHVAVGLAAGELLLDFGVGDDALLDRINEEHAAGLQAALLANVFSGDFEDAGFGGKDD